MTTAEKTTPNADSAAEDGHTPLARKIASANANISAYPLLHTIFDAFTRALAEQMQSRLGLQVAAISLERSVERFDAYIQHREEPTLYDIFEAPKWSDTAMLTLDGACIEHLVDLMMGGDPDKNPAHAGRTPSRLDQMLAGQAGDVILRALAEAFSSAHPKIGDIAFTAPRLEINSRFARITRDNAPCYIARFALRFGEAGREGMLDVILPLSLLEPIRKYLAQNFRGEQRRNDRIWMQHIAATLLDTPMELEVEIDRLRLPVAELSRFEVGMTIELNATRNDQVKIYAPGGEDSDPILTGDLGALRTRKAVKLASPCDAQFIAPLRRMARELRLQGEPI